MVTDCELVTLVAIPRISQKWLRVGSAHNTRGIFLITFLFPLEGAHIIEGNFILGECYEHVSIIVSHSFID